MVKCIQISSLDSRTTEREELVTKKLQSTVLTTKTGLTALNSVVQITKNANRRTGALIIKKWSVFNCMVITTRNCKKMDKLLQTNYATRNWLIRRRRKNTTKPMTTCTVTRTPSGPSLPTVTTLKSPNVSNKSLNRCNKF